MPKCYREEMVQGVSLEVSYVMSYILAVMITIVSYPLGWNTCIIVEPLNNEHIGTSHFVLHREVVLSSEVKMY